MDDSVGMACTQPAAGEMDEMDEKVFKEAIHQLAKKSIQDPAQSFCTLGIMPLLTSVKQRLTGRAV